jgi:heptosyltransferase I
VTGIRSAEPGRLQQVGATRGSPRLLVGRLSSMGDIIHTLPAVSLLRSAFPDALLGWMVEERWKPLLCAADCALVGTRGPGRPLVEIVHSVAMGAWRRAPLSDQTWGEARAALRDLRAVQYDTAIDFQGAVRTAAIARWAGVPAIFGFARPRERIATIFYREQVEAAGTHIVEQNASLAAKVAGVPVRIPKFELPVDAAAEKWCESALRSHHVSEFAILNPGAGWGAKQWPPQRYGEIARGLSEMGLRSLVNFGPGEQRLAEEVERSSGGVADGVPCSLSELTALARRSRLFIGGDTGPTHLAAALGVPVVAIYGPTNPARNGPFGSRSIVLRSPESATSHARREQPEPGLLTITSHHVLRAARQLLEVAGD